MSRVWSNVSFFEDKRRGGTYSTLDSGLRVDDKNATITVTHGVLLIVL